MLGINSKFGSSDSKLTIVVVAPLSPLRQLDSLLILLAQYARISERRAIVSELHFACQLDRVPSILHARLGLSIWTYLFGVVLLSQPWYRALQVFDFFLSPHMLVA
jgi:hypothetical protein